MSELASNCAWSPVQFVAECATDGMKAAEAMRAPVQPSSTNFLEFISSSRCSELLPFDPHETRARYRCTHVCSLVCLQSNSQQTKATQKAGGSISQPKRHAVVQEIGQSKEAKLARRGSYWTIYNYSRKTGRRLARNCLTVGGRTSRARNAY